MARALIFIEIEPKTPADRQKLAPALAVLAAEDGNLEVRTRVERDVVVIGGTSVTDLEQIVGRLTREFGVNAAVGRPEVAYLETSGSPATNR